MGVRYLHGMLVLFCCNDKSRTLEVLEMGCVTVSVYHLKGEQCKYCVTIFNLYIVCFKD